MDSITYTESLQTSILPKHEDFQKSFPKSLLLHRPRDIVSGDFFGTNRLETLITF